MYTFQRTAFHTAEWEEGFDCRDKAIGVIGTGASAIQVVPAILPQVKSLHVFQRTAVWVPPKVEFSYHSFLQAIFHAFRIITKLHRWYIFMRAELSFFSLFKKGSRRVPRSGRPC
jgi:cation diffusion facilitator CzcD-associated flavoprotein CzcO